MTEHLIEHIDRLMGQRPLGKQALGSYRELVRLMMEVEPHPQEVKLEDRLKDIKRYEGFPLFSGDNLPVDYDAASRLLARFLEYLSHSEREDKEGLKKALENLRKDPAWADGLLKAALKKDDTALSMRAKEVDLDTRALLFLTRVALRPSLGLLRNALSDKLNKEAWDYSYCPLCGAQPDMAYFEKSGKRCLHCELCGEEWAYPRLKCPFCENQDHETLGYFHAEEEEGFRVDFCRKCMRYLKTVDKRVLEEAGPMELEYLATIHLDIQATQHGFK
jgi:FdhE protein